MVDEPRDDERREPGPPLAPPTDGGMLSGAQYAGVGIQFAGSILLFLYAGQWVDRKLGTSPAFLISGVFLGAGAAFYSMYRKLVRPRGK